MTSLLYLCEFRFCQVHNHSNFVLCTSNDNHRQKSIISLVLIEVNFEVHIQLALLCTLTLSLNIPVSGTVLYASFRTVTVEANYMVCGNNNCYTRAHY